MTTIRNTSGRYTTDLNQIEAMARERCYTARQIRTYRGDLEFNITDSGADQDDADALRVLAEHGRFRVVRERGCMVVGYWPEHDPNAEARRAAVANTVAPLVGKFGGWTTNPTWSADRIDEEARGLAAMPEDVRRLTRLGDWDYIFALHQNAAIAAGAGLRHMAAQKADFAAETEANIRAVWDRVAAMTANKEATK